MVDVVSKAVEVAARAHAGQVDKGGHPYILHCTQVMASVVAHHGMDAELAAIAVMHDCLEDTSLSLEWLSANFSARVVVGVVALTKVKGEDSEAYLERVLANSDAVKVKIEDLCHNMDLTRLGTPSDADYVRYEKYRSMLRILRGANV